MLEIPDECRSALKPEEFWKLICLFAQSGHARSQYQLGEAYDFGFTILPKDPQQAFKWYRLSKAGGYVPSGYRCANDARGQWTCAKLDRLEEIPLKLTPEELAEAERLAAEWQPNTAECDALLEAETGS